MDAEQQRLGQEIEAALSSRLFASTSIRDVTPRSRKLLRSVLSTMPNQMREPTRLAADETFAQKPGPPAVVNASVVRRTNHSSISRYGHSIRPAGTKTRTRQAHRSAHLRHSARCCWHRTEFRQETGAGDTGIPNVVTYVSPWGQTGAVRSEARAVRAPRSIPRSRRGGPGSGCAADEITAAEERLRDYIAAKYTPKRRVRHIDDIPIADVLSITLMRSFISYTAALALRRSPGANQLANESARIWRGFWRGDPAGAKQHAIGS